MQVYLMTYMYSWDTQRHLFFKLQGLLIVEWQGDSELLFGMGVAARHIDVFPSSVP
jgi:hypothetical protein